MKIFSAGQIKNWDAFTIKEESITSIDLMERAATACCDWIRKEITVSQTIMVFCGSGNNGGDGLAIARLLRKGKYRVSIYLLEGKNFSDDFAINLKRLTALKINPVILKRSADFPIVPKNTVVVDALFGTGLNRPLTNLAGELVHYINKQNATVISIDMPSGLPADICTLDDAIVKATITLSFETYKFNFLIPQFAIYTGQIHILPIGLSKNYYDATKASFEISDQQLIDSIYKPRNQFAHKYSFGHALLYAGSKNMMGAALLCSKACIRSGAGLVTIHVAPDCEAIIHTALPEAISSSDNDTTATWVKKSAIAIGPGLEKLATNKKLLDKLLTHWQGPLVIDATGLSLLSPLLSKLALRKNATVLTPHTGEFDQLFGKTDTDWERLQLAMQKAHDLGCYIVLKGHYTFIACPDKTHYFNTTGNAGMATAGTGDTLTGIICGLLCQGYSARDAAIAGVYLHGLAGDIAAKKVSKEALIASDLIDNLGAAFLQIQHKKNTSDLLVSGT